MSIISRGSRGAIITAREGARIVGNEKGNGTMPSGGVKWTRLPIKMIGLNENFGGSKPAFSVLALMRSLEQQIATAQGKPSDRAQELFYEAMEASTDEEKFELLQQALRLDPGNVDALLAVPRLRPVALEDEIELLGKIVALGERRLGPNALKELAGAFWGVIETRPYMRARGQLAEALRSAGRIEAAIVEWEGMLALNPNDNQGVRYALLACYLALNRLDGAARLFSRFDECPWNTVFAWGRVLERLLSGDEAGARKAVAVARKQNPHMEAYLKGRKRPPRHLPDSYAPGSKEEAACFADTLRMAWERHPEAAAWLRALKPKREPLG
jgi:tetratricopeptide (TPR) repeat protein